MSQAATQNSSDRAERRLGLVPEPSPRKDPAWREFTIGCALGMLLGIPAITSFLNERVDRWNLASEAVLQKLPRDWYDASTYSPTEALKKHQFWLSRTTDLRGVGLRVLENPELFDTFFPGYSAAREDRELWRKYFSRGQSIQGTPIRSPALDFGPWERFAIDGSMIGALDLYSKYGADVVMFAPSRGFFGMIPKVLSDSIESTNGAHPKVLMLGNTEITSWELGRLADVLEPTGRKMKVALVAVAPSSLIPNEGKKANFESQIDLFLEKPTTARWSSYNPISWFGKQFWARSGLLRPTGERPPLSELDFGVDGFRFPIEFRDDLARLESYSRTAAETLKRKTPTAYDLELGSKHIDEMVRKLRKVADSIVIYAYPGTSIAEHKYVEGLYEKFIRMLSSKASATGQVVVVVDDWKSYGLDYRDYVHPAHLSTKRAFFDYNHVNLSGAEKITRRLAAIVTREIKRTEDSKKGPRP